MLKESAMAAIALCKKGPTGELTPTSFRKQLLSCASFVRRVDTQMQLNHDFACSECGITIETARANAQMMDLGINITRHPVYCGVSSIGEVILHNFVPPNNKIRAKQQEQEKAISLPVPDAEGFVDLTT
jgi:hypothetical protein